MSQVSPVVRGGGGGGGAEKQMTGALDLNACTSRIVGMLIFSLITQIKLGSHKLV